MSPVEIIFPGAIDIVTHPSRVDDNADEDISIYLSNGSPIRSFAMEHLKGKCESNQEFGVDDNFDSTHNMISPRRKLLGVPRFFRSYPTELYPSPKHEEFASFAAN